MSALAHSSGVQIIQQVKSGLSTNGCVRETMSTVTPISDSIRRVLENPTGGVAGLVEGLLRVCPERGLQLDWHADHCRVVPLGEVEKVIDVAFRKSVFRAILGRLAVHCNAHHPDSVSPYGGDGELSIGNPEREFRVSFVNTVDEQKVELMPVLRTPNAPANFRGVE
jgi:hypothetical protein